MEATIRPARLDDAGALQRHCYPESSAGDVRDYLAWSLRQTEKGRILRLVAEVEGQAVAHAQLTVWGQDGEIGSLVVAQGYRRRGLATRLLRELIDEVYPQAEQIVLVVDNLNIHHPACLYERFAPAEARRLAAKIEWHYTPEHASWLNIAECELSVLRRQCLRSRMPDIQAVIDRVALWEMERNQRHTTIDWHFTNEDARIKLKRFYPIVNVQ